jgi:exodeoxyribonuclease-5
MLSSHIATLLEKELGYSPTPDQRTVLGNLGVFLANEEANLVFMIRGYAGTGKTTVIAAVVNVLTKVNQQVVLLAPTGRAAKVLSQYSGFPAATIHKKIYRQKSGSDMESSFNLDRNLHRNTVFIVDEASMIGDQSNDSNFFGSGNLLRDMLDYIDSGFRCKLILSGDVAQLPPVGISLSPALREQELQSYGKRVIVNTLRDVIRQVEGSGILFNATKIRSKLAAKEYSLPVFSVKGFADLQVINGSEFGEKLEQCYDKYGIEQVTVISRTNKQAGIYNNGIRQSVLWHEEELVSGDLLMVVKNNYFWVADEAGQKFIANGDIVRLKRVRKFTENFGFRFADATIILSDDDASELDVKLILDTLTSPSAGMTEEQNRSLYRAIEEEYSTIKNKRTRFLEIRNNPYFNALHIKFAYAVTCHKSQGGQWDAVFVDQGYFTEDMLNVEYFRWLYTAITRSKSELYLVNFKEAFFCD